MEIFTEKLQFSSQRFYPIERLSMRAIKWSYFSIAMHWMDSSNIYYEWLWIDLNSSANWVEIRNLFILLLLCDSFPLTLEFHLNDGSKCLKINMIETAHKLSIHSCFGAYTEQQMVFQNKMHFIKLIQLIWLFYRLKLNPTENVANARKVHSK